MKETMLCTGINQIEDIYQRHVDTVYRVCFAYMKNVPDTEDMVADTFYKLVKSGAKFESAEHEKAWLIRTASNNCKNSLKHWWRKRSPIEDAAHIPGEGSPQVDELLGLVIALPDKYKTVVYLYYYEGHTGAEIAAILRKPQSTIRNCLHDARKILRTKLGGITDEE